MNIPPSLVFFVLGVLTGGLVILVWSRWWDWRTPSAERAFQKAWRAAKRMRMQSEELRTIWSVVDLRGDRMLPIIRAIRGQELTLEASTEVIDRLRQRLLDREGRTDGLPEYRLGVRRAIQGTKGYPQLDKATKLPGVVQVGDHATEQAQTKEAADASVRKEWVAGEKLKAEAVAEAAAEVAAEAATKIQGAKSAADRFR